jgi:hypothetical protein
MLFRDAANLFAHSILELIENAQTQIPHGYRHQIF